MLPTRRRKRAAAAEDPPPPAAGAVAGDEEGIKILSLPITNILASLAAGPRRRALPFLHLNKALLAAPAAADDDEEEGEAEVVSPLTAPADGSPPPPPPPKRPRGAAAGADGDAGSQASAPPPPPPHQRRLWVKDRSSEWWEARSSPGYPDAEFRRDFRMSRATFAMVCDALGAAVAKEDTALRTAIPVPQRVAVCVWRLATGEPLRLVSKRFGIGISTCHKLVLEVCAAIRALLMPRFLQWPAEGAPADAVRAGFEARSGVPGVLGAMYTTHVPIIAPKVSVSAYFNRRHTERSHKTSYSITLQGVVGPDGAFTDVCIGWPGSMSDGQVLDKSALQQRAAAGMMAGSWVVAGATYPLTDWLLVPYTHQNVTWTQHAFNEKVADLRRVAVDAFRRLKARWACLQKRTEVKLQDLPVVLGACCVLHNICEARGEPVAPELLEGLRLDIADDDDHMDANVVPDNPVRSEAAAKARDTIAHNLLHRGLAGTAFF